METRRASIAAAGAAAVAGEDCARLRFGARFLVAIAAGGADFASCAVDDDAAADPDDFAARAEDDGESTVVASPKASVKASLVASGGEGFARLRLGPRFFLVRAADFLAASPALALAGFAAGTDAFRFLGMGVYVVAVSRRLEIAADARCC